MRIWHDLVSALMAIAWGRPLVKSMMSFWTRQITTTKVLILKEEARGLLSAAVSTTSDGRFTPREH